MYNTIENTGTLTIVDNSGGGAGILTTYKDSPIKNSGTLTLQSGNISSSIYGIYNQTGGTTTISGGTISGNTYGIYAVGGNVNITGGSITNNEYGTFGNGGTINVSNGSFSTNTYGLYNSLGTTNITGLTLTGNTTEAYCSGGTINITSGNITSTTGAPVKASGSGVINVGTNDGNMSSSAPIIQGETYGIDNSGHGNVNFYDGTIKGKVGGLYGVYNYLENGYTTDANYDSGYWCETLKRSGTVSPVAYIGSLSYTNLQSAINACVSEEATTIQLSNSIATNVPFEVEEDQNVILDLNGFGISSNTAEYTIKNAGNLTIIDSSSSGRSVITNSSGSAIENTGTLSLGENDGTVTQDLITIEGTTYGIVNSDTLNFYDGTINGNSAMNGLITNRATGYLIRTTTYNNKERYYLSR